MIAVHPEVRAALDAGDPVVALESTVITHGLPRPRNLETARMMETTVRDAGAVPAITAVIAGAIRVGLEPAELASLAERTDARKCSRRDLGLAGARGEWGGTTVAATLWIAARAGIRVFATGGIGGVHRGHPFDVSADIEEFGKSPVLVVCAGAKAILDIPLTLEALETRGVPVLGWRTPVFPAFYSTSAGRPVDGVCENVESVAAIARAHWDLGLQTGLLLAAPVPAEHAIDSDEIDDAITRALADADARGIHGKDVTPFLLERVASLTGERSLDANIALLKNNAHIAAQVAAALAGR